MNQEIERRIFIVGVPRSGTTLVQSLLAAHSRLTSFTESHFFARHFTPLRWLRRPILTRNPLPRVRQFVAENAVAENALAENGSTPSAGAAWFENRRSLRLKPLLPLQTLPVARQLLRVFDELAIARNKAGWIEKTPRHLWYLPFLEEVCGRAPRTDFIHVIRDGLETVASLHKASQQWERPYDLETCVRRWNQDVRLSCRRLLAPNDHFVVYEQLTTQPEATLRQLLTALDLDWEPEILERYARGAEELIAQEETWKADVGRRIRPAATAEKVLSAAQREQVSRSLHHDLYQQILERAGRAQG